MTSFGFSFVTGALPSLLPAPSKLRARGVIAGSQLMGGEHKVKTVFARKRFLFALGGAIVVGCTPDNALKPAAEEDYVSALERGVTLDLVAANDPQPFVPLASSAACVSGGKAEQQMLPTGFVQ